MKPTHYTRRAVDGCARAGSRPGVEGLEPRRLLAAQLVKDINVVPWRDATYPSQPSSPIQLGSFALFAHMDREGDVELWRTDGTAGGTRRVKDIAPDTVFSRSGSDPREFVRAGNVAYFLASPTGFEAELWRSDGTEAGTHRVAKTNPTRADTVNNLFAVGSRVYFFADNGTHGNELWTSDGTTAGTRMVEDLVPGSAGIRFWRAGTDGTRLLFQNANQGSGVVYASDGTAAGTGPIPVAGFTGYISAFGTWGGRAYFADDDGYLYRTDANASSAARLTNTGIGSVQEIVGAGDAVFVSARQSGDRLYRYTDAGGLVEVRSAALGGSLSSVSGLTAAGGTLYLQASEPPGTPAASATGRELFRVPPGSATASLVSDIIPGAGESLARPMAVVGDTLYLWARETVTVPGSPETLALFSVAGASAASNPVSRLTTLRPHNAQGGSSWVPVFGAVGNLFLFANNDPATGWEFWRSDGTVAGTGLLADVNPMTNGSDPVYRAPFKGKVLFGANDGVRGTELWITDGTAAGTQFLADTNPGPAGNAGQWGFTPTASGNRMFFVAGTTTERVLWVTDGTPAGTAAVTGAGPYSVSPIVAAGERLYFAANDDIHGQELWTSDGTPPGTYMVADVRPGPMGSLSDVAVLRNGTVIFAADDGVRGMELWRTDGTAGGTTLLKDIHPGATGSSPGTPRGAGGFVYFAATDPVNGRELWRTDGTPAGTVMVADILPGPQGSSPATDSGNGPGFAEYNGHVFFSAQGAGIGRELYRTDGTAAGTQLVKDLLPGAASGTPREMVVAGGRLFVAAMDRPNLFGTTQIWSSDGTPAGTTPLWPQGAFDGAGFLLAHNGRLFFDGGTPGQVSEEGTRLYSSDGTPAGTAPVNDLATDILLNYGNGATPLGDGSLLFFAGDRVHGVEPWRLSDQWAPRVESAALVRQPAGDALLVRLTEDVGATLTEADVTVRDAGTGQPASLRVSYDRASATATVTFPGYAGGVLPNGNYRLTVRGGGVADAAGNVLAADYVLDFFALAGDVNRDRLVNGTDFAILAGNFGRTGQTYDRGDLNGDGSVNGTDFAILAGNFGKAMPAPSPSAAAAAALPSTATTAAPPAAAAPAQKQTKRPRPARHANRARLNGNGGGRMTKGSNGPARHHRP